MYESFEKPDSGYSLNSGFVGELLDPSEFRLFEIE